MRSYDIRKISGYENLWGCGSFLDEFHSLYRKDRSTEKQFQKWIYRKFQQLDTWSISDLLTQDAFEKICDTSTGNCIYSLRRPEFSGNPRILFTIIDSGNMKPRVMLLAFKELHDDYDRYVPIAKKRLAEIEEQFNREDLKDEY